MVETSDWGIFGLERLSKRSLDAGTGGCMAWMEVKGVFAGITAWVWRSVGLRLGCSSGRLSLSRGSPTVDLLVAY